MTLELTRIDLPHDMFLRPSQNRVSVIIRCKTLKTYVVENTALSQMRKTHQEQLAAVGLGVSDDPFACMSRGVHSGDTSSF